MARVRPNPTLSSDLLTEILKRLPVKPLVQYQLVSKTWLSLIKDPAFAEAQLRHTISTGTDETLIITRYLDLRGGLRQKFSLFNIDSCEIMRDVKYPCPRNEPIRSERYFRLVGSTNGIVCVANYDFHPDVQEFCDPVFLWNPAIRQIKILPPLPVGELYDLGFGYDPVDRDYKVVFVARNPCLSVEVYSANSNVWRKVASPIPTALIDRFCSTFHVCVNGFLCGAGDWGMIGMMVVFDLNREVMNCAIKLPVDGGRDDGDDDDDDDEDDYDDEYDDEYGFDYDSDGSYEAEANTRIIEFNKSVGVIVLWANALDYELSDWRWNKKVELWKLDDEACLRGGGDEASWTLMFSLKFDRPALLRNGYFSNGNLLLSVRSDSYMWISCDVDKKDAEIVPLSDEMADCCYCYDMCKYTESLVSLAGFKQISWKAGEDDN
ncbi:F-box/kelch-repeat protein At3g23880-like [Daucus carota subsp. sativus]|uniref:F-box/kelch-repeat protein At3g23880-like n=1 Tax=Daucus carota subsp. sativus TaxID=79200 RepID=UPI003082BE77